MTPSTPMEGTMSGQNSPPSTEPFLAPIVPRPGSSDGSTLSDKVTSTPRMRGETLPLRHEYSPTETGWSTQPPQEIGYRTPTPIPNWNNRPWPTPYSPSHWQRETAPIWTEPPNFDTFNYNEETFRGYAPEPSYNFFPTVPLPLPDSPNWEYQHPRPPQPTHSCRIQGYHPPSSAYIPWKVQTMPPSTRRKEDLAIPQSSPGKSTSRRQDSNQK
ncbi:uncharacterized protein ARMOST_21778 [Armillaria ostoyae]|uniref:Uncharacterized protein n=1 Tax=Armillaria ostoyae TaxID=47428 RepID=A0A284SB06_ARMOS|nr:uncharacterized protein ARMOST_21778 [Armillaria ostoyae]